MTLILWKYFLRSMAPMLLLGWTALVLCFAGDAGAQVTQVYSFEPDLEGFALNGGGVTVSLETSGTGVTHGANSMKLEYTDFSSFAGAVTPNIHPAFNDPLGVDFVRFDFTNTNRFVPENPQPGVTPTYANTSITFFGDLPGNPVQPAQIQFFLTEEALGDLEPGTHEVEIDLSNEGGPLGTGGGLNTDTGIIKGYDAWVDDGFVPAEFQIYINKNGKFAADYVLWRKGGALMNEVADPGTISQDDYIEWRARFGNTAGSGAGAVAPVPEPAGLFVLMIGMAGCWVAKRTRVAR
jgi:hypothetical protein